MGNSNKYRAVPAEDENHEITTEHEMTAEYISQFFVKPQLAGLIQRFLVFTVHVQHELQQSAIKVRFVSFTDDQFIVKLRNRDLLDMVAAVYSMPEYRALISPRIVSFTDIGVYWNKGLPWTIAPEDIDKLVLQTLPDVSMPMA